MAEIIASTYEIIEKIGSGGGGVVYLAKHIRLNKNVVLKADKRKITTRPEILRREVDALKDLSHTYIPQVYDFFIEDDTVYTVIDYIEGESLDRPLKRGERFSQLQVIKWACQLLEALAYLHNPVHGSPPRGIVHSDIKPANIMLKSNGDVCLIDFNIALALGEENVIGLSAGYASPEHYGLDFSRDTSFTAGSIGKVYQSSQSIEDKNETIADYDEAKTEAMEMSETEEKIPVTMVMKSTESQSSLKKIVIPDARSDIYSLGATLYHLISGIRPAKNATEVIPLSEENISTLVAEIITKSMQPNPDLRYQTAEEMLWDFTHLRENDPRTKRRKKIRNIAATVIAAAMAVSVFTSFTGLKRMEANQKILTLAQYSESALANGNPDEAVDYALQALPKSGIFTPDYTEEAQKSLADSLGMYDLSDGYRAQHILELPSEVFKIALSPDGKTAAVVYSFTAAIFDTETGEIKAELPIVKSALSDVVFINDETIAYAGEEGLTVYSIDENTSVWTGKPATHIAVSANGQSIAGIYRNESCAYVYDIYGNEKAVIDFKDNRQKVVENDTFADPMDNLLKLSSDGRYLAVSFENGGLTVFDTVNYDNSIIVYDNSEFIHFEGGFYNKYFSFVGAKDGLFEFMTIDIDAMEITLNLRLNNHMGVRADESGIYLCSKGTVVSLDPVTGEQMEAAFSESDIKDFSIHNGTTAVATEKNGFLIFDENASLITNIGAEQALFDFVALSGDYAVAAGRDSAQVRIFKKVSHDEANIAYYDGLYQHGEARLNSEASEIMLFEYTGFRIYSADGKLINETLIPDAEKVYDQQYCHKSGNLAVIYDNALRIYSGKTGELVFEETELKSVMYTPYGVSILGSDGILRLIDFDTAETVFSQSAKGDFAAYCGMVVDSDLLEGREFIGAGKTESGYYFAASDDKVCTVYNEKGKELFHVPVSEKTEAFFTESEIIISPWHGTPTVYSLKNGGKIADLEKDSYLTYITPVKDYIVSQYISTSEEHYGILLDKYTYKPLAYLPGLADIYNNELIFDYHKGILRTQRIYSIDELIELAKGGVGKDG